MSIVFTSIVHSFQTNCFRQILRRREFNPRRLGRTGISCRWGFLRSGAPRQNAFWRGSGDSGDSRFGNPRRIAIKGCARSAAGGRTEPPRFVPGVLSNSCARNSLSSGNQLCAGAKKIYMLGMKKKRGTKSRGFRCRPENDFHSSRYIFMTIEVNYT